MLCIICAIKYNIWNIKELNQTTDQTTNKTVTLVKRVRILLLGKKKKREEDISQEIIFCNAILHFMILHFLVIYLCF